MVLPHPAVNWYKMWLSPYLTMNSQYVTLCEPLAVDGYKIDVRLHVDVAIAIVIQCVPMKPRYKGDSPLAEGV